MQLALPSAVAGAARALPTIFKNVKRIPYYAKVVAFAAVLGGPRLLSCEAGDVDAGSGIKPGMVASGNALMRALEEHSPSFVVRDQGGAVRALTIPYDYATDQNLSLLAEFHELAGLTLFLAPRRATLTTNGIAALGHVKRLQSLRIQCARDLNPGLLSTACQLTTLRSLTLNGAPPPAQEYCYLTNLTNLKELCLYGVPNFGDAELHDLAALPRLERLVLSQARLTQYRYLTNLTNLKELCLYEVPNFGDAELHGLAALPCLERLVLSQAGLTQNWTNTIATLPCLTNAVASNDGVSVSWARSRKLPPVKRSSP